MTDPKASDPEEEEVVARAMAVATHFIWHLADETLFWHRTKEDSTAAAAIGHKDIFARKVSGTSSIQK